MAHSRSLDGPNAPADMHDLLSQAPRSSARCSWDPNASTGNQEDESRPVHSSPVYPHAGVEKAGDDISVPPGPRRPLHRGNTPTTTTLSRLFAAQAPPSPVSSRTASYNQPSTGGIAYMRAMTSETASLPLHLYNRGFLGGRHSDITVTVFGHDYHLHRIILDRAPYFASALSEPWIEASAKQITLHPEELDSNITKTSFELALKRLYGFHDTAEESAEAIALFATGCWFEMQDLIDASVESLLLNMRPRNLAPMINLVTTNYYGKAGERILSSAMAMLSRDGWEMPLKAWDDIPSMTIKDLVGGDGFFAPGEWDRWVLAKRLLDRRLKATAEVLGLSGLKAPTQLRKRALRVKSDISPSPNCSEEDQGWLSLYSHPDIEPLLSLLDNCIHYVHLDFEQLQHIRSSRDVFWVPVIPEKVIDDALWMNMELRQKVTNAREKDLELNLSQLAADERNMETILPNTERASTLFCKSPAKEKERLGKNTDDPYEASTASHHEDTSGPRRYWIPSSDCNIIIGGSTDADRTPPNTRHSSHLSSAFQAEDYLQGFHHSNPDRPNTPQDSSHYSYYPPFRFSAEFPSPRLLKEKKRVYSRTVFYAGSLWNVYIQKVRSGTKNPQLGVYLHRAKERDPEDLPLAGTLPKGSVDERIGALEREMLLRGERRERRSSDREANGDMSGSNDGDTTLVATVPAARPSGSGLSAFVARTGRKSSHRVSFPPNRDTDWVEATTPSGIGHAADDASTSASSDDDHDLAESTRRFALRHYTPALPCYVDARPTIKTYFKIYSPSKGGGMLSVYESAPDNFNFSQSWGWKSSTLMLDDGLTDHASHHDRRDRDAFARMNDEAEEDAGVERADGRRQQGKLRFMVVIGVV